MAIESAASPDHATSPAQSPTPAVPPRQSPPPPARRVDAVDVLRGVVMVLMVLDHTRDYFGNAAINPTDLSLANPALFLTRWLTHFCAPVFAFLAGTGANLAGSRGRSRGELAAFLATRGLWLIFLEVTVVRLGLFFDPVSAPVILTVLWSIGASFLVLAALVFLPSRLVGAIGVLLIATHGLADRFPLGFGAPGRVAGGPRASAATGPGAAARRDQRARRLPAPSLVGGGRRRLRLRRGLPARAGAQTPCDVDHGPRHDGRLRDPANNRHLRRTEPLDYAGDSAAHRRFRSSTAQNNLLRCSSC